MLLNVKQHQALDREEKAAWRNAQKMQPEAEKKRRADEIQIQMAQINAAREQAKIQADKKLALREFELKAQAPIGISAAFDSPPHNRVTSLTLHRECH